MSYSKKKDGSTDTLEKRLEREGGFADTLGERLARDELLSPNACLKKERMVSRTQWKNGLSEKAVLRTRWENGSRGTSSCLPTHVFQKKKVGFTDLLDCFFAFVYFFYDFAFVCFFCVFAFVAFMANHTFTCSFTSSQVQYNERSYNIQYNTVQDVKARRFRRFGYIATCLCVKIWL